MAFAERLGHSIITHTMECEEKARLLRAHHRAASANSHAVKDLNTKMRNISVAEYKILRAAADEARIKSTEARTALKRHQAKHGC
jgi:hypothetical protein